jgi:hypothetical protein
MTCPAQRPHDSVQYVQTPPEFLAAVQRRFGSIHVDAAAAAPNVCPVWFGPGSSVAADGLAIEWPRRALVWINPPFRYCGLWAQKCAREAQRGVTSLLLTPLSLETRWFEAVESAVHCLVLRPRLKFVGHKNVFPKGLMLSAFGFEALPGGVIRSWRWMTST